MIGENTKEYVNALIDIWNNGDCAVLLDWRIPFITLLSMMDEAGVRECLIEQSYFDKFPKEHLGQIKFITYKTAGRSAEKLPDYIYNKFNSYYGKDEAIIIYSSGTTGNAKGIILSHFAINTNADAIIAYMCPQKNDCIYIVKPFSHSSSIVGELLVALKEHMPLVVSPTIVPPRYVFNAINKFKVSIMCINPTLLSIYSDGYSSLNIQIPSLKKIYVSGSILKKQILEKSNKVFKSIAIFNVYGLSEAGPRVSAQRSDCCNENSVGKAISGVRIKVLDENGRMVSNGETGFVYVKTPSVFSGYVSGDKSLATKYKGWFNTGDIGYFDVKNELYIIGRADDVIMVGSHKIYPSRIEELVMDCVHIQDCTVVLADNTRGEGVLSCLYVSSKDLQTDIKKFLSKHLMKHEIPQTFINIEKIPRNSNGKISTKLASYLITQKLKGGTTNDQGINKVEPN